ncbi:MAG: ribosome maturation factor RimP [Spirochaetaceae bacterium]
MKAVEKTPAEQRLADELRPVIEGLGYLLVELRAKRLKDGYAVHVVLHRAEGIGVDDCAEVHTTILPRIQIIEDEQDINLEVSSPGIDRVLKSPEEFSVFIGKGARVLQASDGQWIGGIISEYTGESVTLIRAGTRHTIEISAIQKAKLDDTQEVE